ncbi:MAG TPA: adenine phosphoribosyltransferase [Prolixibacteraceae bacterium]|nr:adenine phosphoribosyltransferase [Prolixibacteraceae bacterium]
MDLKKHIREIPDFPRPGISFKDITTLLKDKDAYRYAVEEIYSAFSEKKITKVVSLESRGFIIGGALAFVLEAGFVPIRKAGKLPADTFSVNYELEYGCDAVEIHKDALVPEDVVLIHDDLLATGGTALAALKLVRQFNVREVYFSFLCDLSFIQTPQKDELNLLSPQILFSYT